MNVFLGAGGGIRTRAPTEGAVGLSRRKPEMVSSPPP